jgi:hypothetical protein
MTDPGQFQRAFSAELLRAPSATDESSAAPFGVAITVHRNTVVKGLVDALAANYPTVAQLVGAEWFRACAIEYVHANPARSPILALYGETFAEFLSAFPSAGELAYLPDVARLDRMWIEAHTARDEEALMSEELRQLSPAALAAQRMTLHPATRMGWVRHSAASIWVHHRSESLGSGLTIDDCEEGLLLTRPAGAVEFVLLDAPRFTFLDRLRRGATLGEAAEAALEADNEIDIAGLLAQSIVAGTFTRSLREPS